MNKEIIVKADINDVEEITSLTKISKAFWGYDEEQIKKWEKDLTMTKGYIIKNKVYKMTCGNNLKGYYSYIEKENKVVELDNIFLHPDSIRKEYGAVLMNDFLKKVKKVILKRFDYMQNLKPKSFTSNLGLKQLIE
jgi:N-acetylglutamate synthase-like GNAT family acetyltransferase